MWRTITTDYLHGSTECLLKDRHRCSLDNLKIGDHIVLIQRYKDEYGVYHTSELLGLITNLSDPLYTNLFIHFSDHHNIDICALTLRCIHKGKILRFKETNTYRTIHNMILDVDLSNEQPFTIQSIGNLKGEPFKSITIMYPVYMINQEIIHILLPVGLLALIDKYIFDQ